MEFLNGLSDDQTALVGCAFALLVCGTIMSLSYYIGRFFHKPHATLEPNEPHTLKMPDPLALKPKRVGSVHLVKSAPEQTRRAA